MYYTSNVELQVLINNKPVKTYGHNGYVYIEGRIGTEFTLKIKNNNSGRILAVPSIDGLSVIDGEEASSNSGGYIIEGYSSYEVKGWRTSLKDVSKFVFSKKGNSFSNKTRKGFSNCGVIGCVVYTEKCKKGLCKSTAINLEYTPPYTIEPCTYQPTSLFPYGIETTDATGKYNGYSNRIIPTGIRNEPIAQEIPNFKLGTDYGESINDNVIESDFKKDYVLTTFEIHYTTRNELQKIGVDIEKRNNKIHIPSAFTDRKFCKLPERK